MTRSARKAAAAAAAAALIASQQSQEEEAAAAAAAAVEAERVAAAERAAAEAKAAAAARAAERAYSATVTFVINKSDIRSEEIPVLDKVVAWMNQYPEAKVDLQGYADKFTGTAERNMVLSEERAKTVAAYLESKGIALSRMAVEFFGDTKSISTVPASNRAVVIKVY